MQRCHFFSFSCLQLYLVIIIISMHIHPQAVTYTCLAVLWSSLWLQEEDDENLYMSIQRLRDRTSELSIQVSLLERSGSGDLGYQQSLEELRAAQDQLSELVEARNRRWRDDAAHTLREKIQKRSTDSFSYVKSSILWGFAILSHCKLSIFKFWTVGWTSCVKMSLGTSIFFLLLFFKTTNNENTRKLQPHFFVCVSKIPKYSINW